MIPYIFGDRIVVTHGRHLDKQGTVIEDYYPQFQCVKARLDGDDDYSEFYPEEIKKL